jgi:1-acyl-sn-glycerol-3-phosphate acyltransferase
MSLERLVSGCLCFAARVVSGARVRWLGCAPSTEQRIYFANHSSHLDLLLLWSALPAEVRDRTCPLAARDYWERGPLRRYLARRVFHAVMIERPGRGQKARTVWQAFENAVEAMGTDRSLILFPEGTRGSGETVQPFRAGLYHIARKKREAPLVPVYMENLNRILPKGELFPIPLISSITFGAPFRLGESDTKAEFLERARDRVVELGAG